MNHVFLLVYFTIAVNVSAYSLEFSVGNVLSHIEENFKVDQLYSRSQLLIKNASSTNPQLLWNLMALSKYTKGFRSRKEDVKPSVYFFSSNEGSHRFKCFVDRNSIKHCEISFSKSVIGNKNGVIERINNLKTMLSYSEYCTAQNENPKSRFFINTLCKSEKANLVVVVKYKPGQSKNALIDLKLVLKS